MNIKQIKDDLNSGLTHGEIKSKHGLSDEVEFAISQCSDGLTIEQIYKRVKSLSPSDINDKSIERTMKPKRWYNSLFKFR